jgi:hypothetical protein
MRGTLLRSDRSRVPLIPPPLRVYGAHRFVPREGMK